ncbi:RlmE family RNA methyltransferase [Treponema sp. OMZ 840]|uniref:SAM-dependent methyltransferase n=1 Tax=Treponema sp. OMZ 840 TaxID=244313 RepID=UPI003D8A29B8
MSVNSYEKPDFWSKKAFSEGYPARSVYKLKEINEKYSLFTKGSCVLDLGAAPGSWTVFILRTLAGSGKVVSVDLKPLAKNVTGTNLVFLQGDLYDEDVQARLKSEGPYDVLVCDAAPPTTGNRLIDTSRSVDLAETAVYYAQAMLKKGGHCAVKIFQGGDQQAVLAKMKTLFSSARSFKPAACRSESFETYLIGLGKKAD